MIGVLTLIEILRKAEQIPKKHLSEHQLDTVQDILSNLLDNSLLIEEEYGDDPSKRKGVSILMARELEETFNSYEGWVLFMHLDVYTKRGSTSS
jgi:hypothetical protein